MKARRVGGLGAGLPLGESIVRIVEVRAGELRKLGDGAARDLDEEALHDTRIAAKRLRYVLELAEPVFGSPARRGAQRARELQDLLGALHDADVLLARLRRHARALRRADVASAAEAAAGADDLDAGLAAGAPGRLRRRGLATLEVWARARRRHLRARFAREWERLARAGWPGEQAAELEAALPAASGRARDPGAASFRR